jgi:hypothetical protein
VERRPQLSSHLLVALEQDNLHPVPTFSDVHSSGTAAIAAGQPEAQPLDVAGLNDGARSERRRRERRPSQRLAIPADLDAVDARKLLQPQPQRDLRRCA